MPLLKVKVSIARETLHLRPSRLRLPKVSVASFAYGTGQHFTMVLAASDYG
jgi:hypothetical protein